MKSIRLLMASLFIFTSGAAFSMPRYLGKFTVTSPESSKILQVVNRGEIEIFFDLVAANPRILNLRLNTNEDTPLHVAARMGNLKFVQCLIRAGADATATNREGATPAMLAIQAGHYAIMQVLTRRVQFSDNLPLINQQPAALFSPLPNRAQSSYVPQYFPVALVQEQFINEAVAVLPSENRLGYANPPSNNNNNQEPEQDDFFEELFDMIREGKVELFYDFLNMIEGVDLGSILDREGNTLLHLAAQLGRADFVQRLIQAGANINTLNQAGDTPAVLALHAEHFHVVQLFTRGGQGLTNLSLINQRSEASIFPAPSITQSAYLPQGSVFLQVPTQPINGEDFIIDYDSENTGELETQEDSDSLNAEERFTHYSQKDFAPLPAPFNPNGEAFRGEYIFHVYQPNILDNRRSNESLSSVPSSLLSAFRLTTEGLRSLSIFSRNGLGYINPSSSNNNNNNNNSVIPLPTPENRDLASLTAVRRLSNSLPEPRPFLVSHFFKAFNAVSSTDQVGAALHT